MRRDDDAYYDELADLRAEALSERRYRNALMRHPDCRDPDHPGCEDCDEDFQDEDLDDEESDE